VTAEPLALYVHWPFCVSKCPYCDFNSHVRSNIDQDEWRDALLTDLAYEAGLLPGRKLTSIFFGGGTPSLMDPATVSAVIGAAQERWQAADDLEITLEANPNSVEAARFADLAAAGVNRLSLGLQSFDDASLAFLNRAHSSEEGQKALDIAQAHFPRVSFDLIYALPGETEAGWSSTLDRALAKGTSHLSLYQLTIEPGTRFASMVAKHEFEPLDGDEAATLYELTAERTANAGIPAYEISNYARPGQECRHNLLYWSGGSYAGLGPSAASHVHGTRFKNIPHLGEWERAIERGELAATDIETLSPRQRADELAMLRMRLDDGLDFANFTEQTGLDACELYSSPITRLKQLGLIEADNTRMKLSDIGLNVADAVAAELMSAPSLPV